MINIHTIKPIDKDIIIEAAKKTGRIVTAEEHSVIGGLGEAVASLAAEEAPCRVVKIGINDKYGYSGPAAELLKLEGLCAENIAAKAKALAQRK